MKEKKKARQDSQTIADYFPPIINCSGGLNSVNLHGRLTEGEMKNVKGLPVVRDIRKQEAVSKKYNCPTQGKTAIAYYPREILSILERNPIIAIQALCLNTRCKHNFSSPAKK